MKILILLSLLLSGCVTLGYHKQMVQEARAQELERVKNWVLDIKRGEMSLDDLLAVVGGRLRQ